METINLIKNKTYDLKFYRGKQGNIVAKLPNGKLALSDNTNPLSNSVQEDEIWKVEIKSDKTFCAIVTPIEKVLNANS